MKFSIDFVRTCYLPKLRSLLCSIFPSFIGIWVKTVHRNRSACSQSTPVQSSRSKSTTCQRVGRLPRFKQHRNFRWQWAKAWNRSLAWYWINCNHSLPPNPSQTKCDVWKRDLHWLDELWFHCQFKGFWSNLLLKIIFYCVIDQPSITVSRRSVLNFKFSALTFLRSMGCLMSIEQNWAEIFQPGMLFIG